MLRVRWFYLWTSTCRARKTSNVFGVGVLIFKLKTWFYRPGFVFSSNVLNSTPGHWVHQCSPTKCSHHHQNRQKTHFRRDTGFYDQKPGKRPLVKTLLRLTILEEIQCIECNLNQFECERMLKNLWICAILCIFELGLRNSRFIIFFRCSILLKKWNAKFASRSSGCVLFCRVLLRVCTGLDQTPVTGLLDCLCMFKVVSNHLSSLHCNCIVLHCQESLFALWLYCLIFVNVDWIELFLLLIVLVSIVIIITIVLTCDILVHCNCYFLSL